MDDAPRNQPPQVEVGVSQDDAKVIAPDASCKIGSPDAAADARGGAANHRVTRIVSVRFIHGPCSCQVDHDQGHRRLRRAGLLADFAQAVIEGVAVVQPGEVVGPRFAFQPAHHGVAAPQVAALFERPEDARFELRTVREVLFAEEVMRAELQCRQRFAFVIAVRQQDHGHIAVTFAQEPHQVVVTLCPEAVIDESNVKDAFAEQPLRLFDAARGVRQELAVAPQQLADGADILHRGIDDEDAKDSPAVWGADCTYCHGYDSPKFTIGTLSGAHERNRDEAGEIRWRSDLRPRLEERATRVQDLAGHCDDRGPFFAVAFVFALVEDEGRTLLVEFDFPCADGGA